MSNTIELINRVEALEAELQKLKEELVHAQDEPKIPDFPVFDVNGEASWWINNALEGAHHGMTSGHVEDYNYFHTEEYAQEFADKCKLIAMMLHCKWHLDRDYVPDWENIREYEPAWSKAATKKWFVCFNSRSGDFVTDYEYSVLRGQVYFSSMEIAQKCADWLNEHWRDSE